MLGDWLLKDAVVGAEKSVVLEFYAEGGVSDVVHYVKNGRARNR